MSRKQAGQHILGIVGVLILVHQHIAELPLVQFQHIRVALKQQHGFHDDVIKVERTRLAHLLFVQFIDVRHLFTEVVACGICGKLLWRHQLVLGAANHTDNRARVKGLRVEV